MEEDIKNYLPTVMFRETSYMLHSTVNIVQPYKYVAR